MEKQYLYVIENKITKMKYYGRTGFPSRRKNSHFSELRRNIHGNDKMQKSFNKYGEENFEFYVIEEISKPTKEEALQAIMDLELKFISDTTGKFNISTSSSTPSNYIFYGVDNPFYGRKHSDESKKLQSLAKKGMYDGEKNPFYGKTHTKENREKFAKTARKNFKGVPKSKEHREKIGKANRNNETNSLKVEVDGIPYPSLNEASRVLGISRHIISHRARSEKFSNYKLTSDKRKV